MLKDTAKQITNTWKIKILQRPSKYISYLDMNNLYGRAMSRYLLYGRFKWLKNVSSVWCKLNQWKIPIGYILKVNLEYREELNVLHNDYPLAPEKLAIPYEILSDYRKKIADRYGINVGDVMKWNPNLGHKTN